jgi:hypothetical protein
MKLPCRAQVRMVDTGALLGALAAISGPRRWPGPSAESVGPEGLLQMEWDFTPVFRVSWRHSPWMGRTL